jgi:hypothetical protein
MADVFVSYAKEDRNRIVPLVQALETAGFEVWWDRQIDAGKSFNKALNGVMRLRAWTSQARASARSDTAADALV